MQSARARRVRECSCKVQLNSRHVFGIELPPLRFLTRSDGGIVFVLLWKSRANSHDMRISQIGFLFV